MSKSLNKYSIIGNVGREPELKYTQDGVAILNFSVAVNGEKETDTFWVKVVVWRAYAETLNELIGKGAKVYVEGSIKPKPWKRDDGTPEAGIEITAKEVYVLSGFKNSQNGSDGDDEDEELY